MANFITTTIEGNKITVKDSFNKQTHVFEIVEEFPEGYEVWNIGRHGLPIEGMVPLCKLGYNPEPWMRNVDINSLKAIKCPSEEIALKVLRTGGYHTVYKNEFNEIINGTR